ncbi:MAG TPA: twin-arginine translocase TatA/TatE family subunit [Verrucomicrobiae bacterium]|nr:twin-arginine translocase TatA/TatE family subunit [Verrucomicrobiae bacterium]
MNTTLALFNLGGGEIILILALILILFGARKLPELAKGLGQGIKEFKKATREVTDEVQSALDEPPAAPQRRLPASETASTPEQPHTVAQSSPGSAKA